MRLRGVDKSYQRGSSVLADVNVDLPPGELVAFSGGNGSGKSTLLRVLVGVTRPTKGEVLERPSPVGYVPDRFPPDERMSARSYLTHMGRISGLRTSASRRRADELLERLSLAGGVDTPLSQLSKGNARKVALAQALVVTPRLLVLDEPWSGLDSTAHGVLAEIMQETAGAGGSVAFTDHRESVVQANATRIYRVAGGRVTFDERSSQAAQRSEIRVILRAPVNEHGIPRTADWTAFDGVLTADLDGEFATIRVSSAHADELIVAALSDGWSMVEAGHVSSSQVAAHGSS